MVRKEVYCIDEKKQIYFTRWELENQPVAVAEKDKTTSYYHKDYPTHCVRWTGLHLTQYGEQPVKRAMGSQVCDAGPKVGISVAVELAPDAPYSQEEREAGRERIRRAVEQIYGCRCEWTDKGGERPNVGEAEEKAPQAV